jgi:hypothetical protein
MWTRQIVFVAMFSAALLAQSVPAPSGNTNPASPTAMGQMQPAPPANDPGAQIRDDLNRMESLNMNMSSEIEFLRDQNLQILLRTNAQMWTILIRDLRRQLEAQQRPTPPPPPEKPNGR